MPLPAETAWRTHPLAPQLVCDGAGVVARCRDAATARLVVELLGVARAVESQLAEENKVASLSNGWSDFNRHFERVRGAQRQTEAALAAARECLP